MARRIDQRWLGVAVVWAGLWAAGPGLRAGESRAADAKAPAPAAVRAHLLPVTLPITGSVDQHVKRRIDQLLGELPASDARPLLILEFRSRSGQAEEASEFERCLSLARYLASDRVAAVRTIAYLPNNVKGHAVLAVLACEEIVIAPDAVLGDAGVKESHIDATMRRGYTEIAERRRTIPVAVALGMLDKEVIVHKVQTLDGVRYVLGSDLDALKRSTTVSAVESVGQPGDTGQFTGRDLRLRYGFASHLAGDRGELAAALQVAPQSLEEDPSLGGAWSGMRIAITGPIHHKSVNWLERSIRQQLAGGRINFLCIAIDSPGGSVTDSIRLANYLASLDPSEVRTVAYVVSEARADAALIALACDQLVMADEAILGGPGAVEIEESQLPELRRAVRAIAESKQRDWSLWVALLDPALTVHRYTREGTGLVRLFSDEEVAQQSDPDVWHRGEVVGTQGGITGSLAEQLTVARFLASDLEEFEELYHLEERLQVIQPNWAHLLVERLATPQIAGLLLFVAWFALLVELSHPGLSVAGFVSMLCFMVYFWSQFLHGTAGWLEILLFGVGIISVALEIFVMPGSAVFGFGGGLLIIVSIVLASQTFIIPRNTYQLEQLPGSLMMVAAGGAGAFVSLVVMRRYLAEAPILKRLMLATPGDDDTDDLSQREALVDYRYLNGKRGRATTPLVPAGKAQFGDDVVDVISDGELLARGTDISVVKVLGNQVYVQAIDGERG
jgi:membrane-bound ClpP family serine protease